MATVSKFTVVPKLPARIEKLLTIANNLWWCWNGEAIELFLRVDRDLWTRTNQSPRRLLGEVSQLRLEELARDDSFLAHLDRVADRLDQYLASPQWRSKHPNAPEDFTVAYFSAEFGIHESISIYSGGLGVLAGDHLKAASDLGLPLVGIGLLYREGYFQQYLNADGWQQERYPRNDFYNLPLELARDAKGKPVEIEVEYPGRIVKAHVWKLQVGRVPLYLLDADHDDNLPEDREITFRLYGGDRDTRIRQEILLGMGGINALDALGIAPTCFHMNEGHSAFMTLQRIREIMEADGLGFHQALETVKAGSVFTTHTPVPAGNDMFDPPMIEHYFSKYCEDVDLPMNDFLALGRQDPQDQREPYCMTVLALKASAHANGVSALHGKVARNMWRLAWKDVPENEVPIRSITNGVHTRFWISRDLATLYDRYLGPRWVDSPDDQTIWKRISEVPDTELWRTHERRRERLVSFARRRLYQQLQGRGAPPTEMERSLEVLDSDVLTIGFARRFATYKRATLILHDRERLRRILTNHDMPVQFIIAGKAHPADHQAKHFIRELVHFARDAEIRNRFVFIENYDMNVARYLAQGVDCWLNTPRRPMEASGTSGMKVAANGGLNISIPDGWWVEAEELGPNGWSIGKGETYGATEEQDQVESRALYEILEKEVVPMYYDRGRDGLPREWIARMKGAIGTICPVFNTYRMVQEYADTFYVPSSIRKNRLKENKRRRGLALALWKDKIRENWSQVAVTKVESGSKDNLLYGTDLHVKAQVTLGKLDSADVIVEIFYGDLDPSGQIPMGDAVEMKCVERVTDGAFRYEGDLTCNTTGQQGFTVRVIPSHPDLAEKQELTLIKWA
jgi:starch phosphorylase